MPGEPGHGAGQHGHLRVRHEIPVRPAPPRCRRPNSIRDFGKDLIPHLVKHGKAPWRIVSPLLRAIRFRGRRLLARCRHGRRLLAGEHRPDRHHARARPLRQRLADLDLWRGHAARQVRARRRWSARRGGQFAGLRRLHRLAARRCGNRCCSPACACTPFASIESTVVLPQCRYRPRRAAAQRHRRSRRAHSARAWWSARTRWPMRNASAAPITACA